MSRLVIVESPTKAKTISGFLPKEYAVKACMGHVRDLPESAAEIPEDVKKQAWARIGVNVEHNFEPLYIVPAKKKKVITELKAALKGAQELIIATDEDREGESIGWHLLQVLKPKVPVRRMVFHEITKDAIQDALRNPRDVDEALVRAQETRRVLDRLVGYTVSPLLWKKIAPGLSAGRVQSVAVRLLVNREEERRAFRPATWFDLKAILSKLEGTTPAEKARFEAMLATVNGQRVASGKDFDPATGKLEKSKQGKVVVMDKASADTLRDTLKQAAYTVRDLVEKPQTRRPAPPFTTSTLQQEANRKLRLPAKRTMQIAQSLYENGHITYMRTDSVNLSSEALNAARNAVTSRYGKQFLSEAPRRYTTKAKGAQEAHEAIRPAGTLMRTADEIGLSAQEASLYDLIWKRTIASQMADARLTLVTATITATKDKTTADFTANGKRIDFPGFFRAYVEGNDDPEGAIEDQEVILPPLQKDDSLKLHGLESVSHTTQPPARFTEASLVQTLESEGVGRPSTYATIISTIQDRGYVVKVSNQLVPTFTAFAVNRLMEGNFPDLVDTHFTARMEETLDDIAEGKTDYLPYLRAFYSGTNGLEKQVEAKTQEIDPREIYALNLPEMNAKVRIGKYGPYLEQDDSESPKRVSLPEGLAPADLVVDEAEKLLRKKSESPDSLGEHPRLGQPIYVLQGRFGPYVQLGQIDPDAAKNAPKPRRASLPKGMSPEQITLEQAVRLLELPRDLGLHPDTMQSIEANVGRFGPYVKHGDEFRSLTADDDVYTITAERAVELLRTPKQIRARQTRAVLRELGAHPGDGKPVTVMSGQYGPYVKHGTVNATIPRGSDVNALTMPQAVDMLNAKAGAPAKKTTRTRKPTAAKAAPKTATKSATRSTAKTGTKSVTKTTRKPAARKPAKSAS